MTNDYAFDCLNLFGFFGNQHLVNNIAFVVSLTCAGIFSLHLIPILFSERFKEFRIRITIHSLTIKIKDCKIREIRNYPFP
jgi:hypothetical protein